MTTIPSTPTMPLNRPRARPVALLPLLLLAAGCERVEQVIDARRDLTPHESYAASLADAGLAESALGHDWMRAAATALQAPLPVPLPYREEGFLAADDPAAIGLRLTLLRGQVLTVRTHFDADDTARVFVDLFRVPDVAGDPMRPLARVDSLPDGMVYEPYRDGDYVLRLQPELLRGGRYRLELTLDPVLSFPVEGVDQYAIWSGWGDPRDGGARLHRGVDIFAARGTPALAASPGVVTRVEDTSRGGLVVWVRDEARGQNLYYAHLSEQLVTPGTRVEIGDTVGLVGNTGNARTTPPHLHFGVYVRGQGERRGGAQDPVPYLVRPRRPLPRLPALPERLGAWARVGDAGAELHAEPVAAAAPIERLAPHTPIRLLAGSGDWWRVGLPDGRVGWVADGAAHAADDALRETVLAAAGSVRTAPSDGAPVMEPLDPGSRVSVMGEFSGYLWVRAAGGRAGWLPVGD